MKWLSRILQHTLRSFESSHKQLTRPPIAAASSSTTLASTTSPVPSSNHSALILRFDTMAPKQATLGNFFGKQNGAKSAPKQQSTLSFGKKPAAKKDEVKEEAEEDVKPKSEDTAETKVEQDVEGDVKMTDGNGADDSTQAKNEDGADASTQVKKEDDYDEENVKPAKAVKKKVSFADDVSTTSKKRSAEPDEASEEASDDEPPTKKPRRKAVEKSKATIMESKVKKEDEEAEDEADEDSGSSTKKPAKQPEKNGIDTGKTKAAVSKTKARAPAPAVVEKDDMDGATESDPQSEAEAADESDEDNKPEKLAQNQAKVQSTLKSMGKDFYPDWKAGEPVPYAALCTTFSKIEMTTKRLEIQAYCALFMRQVARLTPNDLLPTVLLMLGKLAADYTGVELGIGESLIMKAIGESTGRSLQIIKADQQEIGDLGLVAAKSRSNQPTMFKPKPLTIRGVHEGLMKIALIEGQGAQSNKVNGIKKLLSSADLDLSAKGKSVDITTNKGGPSESKYIVRTLEGKMRLGLAEKTVLISLANAMVYHDFQSNGKKDPSHDQIAKGEQILKNVYNELPSYEVIIPAIIEHGIFKLREACNLQPGVPLKPMLARPTKSITEVLDRFEGKDFTCEYKYDGERAQIHFVSHDAVQDFATPVSASGKSDKGVSNIFSRNSEDLSKKYPDILARLPTWVKDDTKSFVLDCETVAWDVMEKKVLPFQQLMTRKRKDVKTEDIKVKVCVFAFDILYLNGEAMVNKSFRERRQALYGALKEVEGEFTFAQYGNFKELDQIQVFLEESVKASCEGLMVKMLDGPESHYEPSRRSQNWLKVKKDYLAGAGDSLDLVVLGAYYGKGKRTSVYGAFLLACWNPSTEKFESVCNIGTGFSDEILQKFYDTLSPLVIDRPKPFYSHSAGNKDQPDVWFEPRHVWEVKTADLTLSPRYRAAADEVHDPSGNHRGISLRFPRFIKERDDKKPESATSSKQVAEMYRKQDVVSAGTKKGVDDDFEY